MNFAAPQRLLLDALILPPALAAAAWRSWRGSADLNRLDDGSFHLLPALAGRMPAWIADDPQQAILKGVCRRAWSQNQVQRKLLADALEVLIAAGIERVAATGPVLWGALYWPGGAIRPIGMLDLLVEPPAVRLAFETLLRAGWKAPNGLPDNAGTHFYFAPGALLQSPRGDHLRLHWRALPNTDLSIRRPEFPPLEPMDPGLIARYKIPLEHSLVAALGDIHADGVDWHLDALMISRQPGLRWDKVAALLRWRSAQRERLAGLRDFGATVPQAVTTPVWTSHIERTLASALRSYRRSRNRGEPL
jgi:Uncharacterised nucleotidyltransferase